VLAWWLAAALLAFVGWLDQKRRQSAGSATVIEPGIFSSDTFRLGVSISLAFSAANTGFLFVFAYALQRELGYSALQTGMLHMPFSAGVMFAMAFLVRRYLARYGRLVLIVGAVTMAAGCSGILAWMALGARAPAMLVPVLVVAGVGMGMVSGPLGSVSVARVERRQAGSASGILKTVQQTGGALGVALVGTVYIQFSSEGSGGGGERAALTVLLCLLALCLFWAARLPREIFPRHGG
jgi:MFS family permease